MAHHDYMSLENILKDIGFDKKIPNIEYESSKIYKNKTLLKTPCLTGPDYTKDEKS